MAAPVVVFALARPATGSDAVALGIAGAPALGYSLLRALRRHDLDPQLEIVNSLGVIDAVRENRSEIARACFQFLPARAQLDLAGWADADIFAH